MEFLATIARSYKKFCMACMEPYMVFGYGSQERSPRVEKILVYEEKGLCIAIVFVAHCKLTVFFPKKLKLCELLSLLIFFHHHFQFKIC